VTNATRPASDARNVASQYRGGLARTLVRTLLVFTFIPLILMGGAAYYRAQALLRDQVVRQMQAQLSQQVGQVNLSVQTKAIRLDRLVRSPDFISAAGRALAASAQSPEFTSVRSDFAAVVQSLNPQGGTVTFNQYFLMSPSGTVALASNPAWQGLSLQDLKPYQYLSTGERQSYAAYDTRPLYNNQLALFTVAQISNSTGAHLGTMVGVTEPQELQTILQNLVAPGSGAEALFVTQEGSLIGADPYTNAMALVAAPAAQVTPIMAALTPMMSQDTSAPASVTFTNQRGIPSFGQVLWLNSLHAGIVYQIDNSRVFASLNSLIPFTVGVFLAALLAMGLVLSLGTQRVFRPLAGLADIARRFSEGDFGQRAEARSKDEIGLLAHSFNQMADQLQATISDLERRVAERTRDLENQTLRLRTAAEVARDATLAPTLEELLDRAARLMLDRFRLHHVGIFLLDETRHYAVLRAAPSPIGRNMMAASYRVPLGEKGAVSQAAATGEPSLVRSGDPDFPNLGDGFHQATRAELALPLRTNEGIIGVLDLQSDSTEGLGPADTSVMQILADQLAAALERSRLMLQVQARLRQLEQSYLTTTEKTWMPAAGRRQPVRGYTYDNVRLEPVSAVPHAALLALKTGTTQVTQASGRQQDPHQVAAVPIQLRGQTLGVIHVNFRGGQVPQQTLALIQDAANRLGTGIENIRLLEDSLARANKERLIGEIASRIGSSMNVRNIVRTAAEELGRALPGTEVSIRFRSESVEREEEVPA
jgi:GAF domain-containing protein/HAMP domain-containing protein